MSVSLPPSSSEKIHEASRYLRLLQQLGDHAVTELVCDNPVFQQHFAGALAPNKREIIKEQSDVLGAGVGKLARTAAEEAEAANSHLLATVLHQFAQQAPASGGDCEIVHPATRRLLMVLDELDARKNYIEIAGAIYTLFKMAPAEKILHPDENAPQQIRQATHSQVQVAGLVPADNESWEREIPTGNDGSAAPVRGIAAAVLGGTEELEQALENYASAYYPLRGCIMPGMDAVIEAKKRFYRELASDFEEDSLQPLKVSNLS